MASVNDMHSIMRTLARRRVLNGDSEYWRSMVGKLRAAVGASHPALVCGDHAALLGQVDDFAQLDLGRERPVSQAPPAVALVSIVWLPIAGAVMLADQLPPAAEKLLAAT